MSTNLDERLKMLHSFPIIILVYLLGTIHDFQF